MAHDKCLACGKQQEFSPKYIAVCDSCLEREQEEISGHGCYWFEKNHYADVWGNPVAPDECPHVVPGKWEGTVMIPLVLGTTDDYGNDHYECMECFKKELESWGFDR